jgi:hypothetical protein
MDAERTHSPFVPAQAGTQIFMAFFTLSTEELDARFRGHERRG